MREYCMALISLRYAGTDSIQRVKIQPGIAENKTKVIALISHHTQQCLDESSWNAVAHENTVTQISAFILAEAHHEGQP